MNQLNINSEKSFTLLELLIVIGILAILTTTAVVVLNPAELLKQARDSTRLVDLKTIDKALSLYQTQGGSSFGASNTVYVSIPDISSTCNNLGLPSLPSGWFYACASTSTFRKVDGTGWIPVNFASIPVGSLPVLPVDPINSASTGNYYTYVTGGSWVLASLLESEKYLKQIGLNDGGIDDGRFEIGNNLQLWANVYGLVGYWKFDEGSGVIVSDSSGNGNNGALDFNGPAWVMGKLNQALSFNGWNNYVRISDNSVFNLTNVGTVIVWTKISSSSGGNFQTYYPSIVGKGGNNNWLSSNGWNIFAFNLAGDIWDNKIGVGFQNGAANKMVDFVNSLEDQWVHIAGVWDGSNIYIYQNGTQKNSSVQTISPAPSSYPVTIGGEPIGLFYFNGEIDEVRIYNRALLSAEIMAIYNATK